VIGRRALLQAGSAALLTGALKAQTSSAAKTLRAADIRGSDYPTVQALFFIDRALRRSTGGDFNVRVFPEAQLGEESEIIEQLRLGAIDMARVNIMSFAQLAPEFAVLGLPGIFLSPEHFRKFADGPVGRTFLDRAEGKGFVGLTFFDAGSRYIYNRLRPIERPEDVRDMKLRVDFSNVSEFLPRALGAIPMQLTLGHLLHALNAGLVDGCIENIATYAALDHNRVARYLAMSEMGSPPDVLLISLRAWSNLNIAERAALMKASEDARYFMRAAFDRWTAACLKQVEEQGAIITRPSGLLQPARAAIYEMLAQLDMMQWFEMVREAR